MNNRSQIGEKLAALLDQHQVAIAASWAEKVYQNASFRPDDMWLKVLLASTTQGLSAMSAALATGSYLDLEAYLVQLSYACLRSGFESGEVTEALLLCKDAILPEISRLHSYDLEYVLAMIAELDTCLRWTAGHFNTLYATEMNRRLRGQHEHIVRMLKLGQQAPASLDIADILRHIAQGIISSIEADHCDFYLVDENQSHFMPMSGISKTPLPPMLVENFLKQSPDVNTDIFLREIMERKEPLVCHNAQSDPRANRELINLLGVKSVLAVPLVAHDMVLAIAMTGTFDSYRTFTQEQIELAWDVARAGTLIIENARLYEKRLAEYQSFQRGISALLQELELEDVLKIVCTEAQRMTGTRGSAVYLLDGDEWLQLFFHTGDNPAFERIPIADSLTGLALREGRTILTNCPAEDKRLFCNSGDITNLLTAPLIANGKATGVLYAVNKPLGFTDDDAHLIGIFADQAAIAIENAQLHRQVRHMAALEERERLAREIHDNLAQALSVLKLQASHVEDLLQHNLNEKARTYAAEMIKTAEEAYLDAREAIFSLRNSASSYADFLPMLQAHLERYHRIYGLDAHLETQDAVTISLPTTTMIQVTRIIQEALANVRKHAKANSVHVYLTQNDEHLIIKIADDGQGFDPAAVTTSDVSGVGLQIMRERAESAGGKLEVETQPGKGTHVVVYVPWSEQR